MKAKQNVYGTISSLVYWGLFGLFAVLLAFQMWSRPRVERGGNQTHTREKEIKARPSGGIDVSRFQRDVQKIVRRTQSLGQFKMLGDQAID